MKKFLMLLMTSLCILSTSANASGYLKMKITVSDLLDDNFYYLCLYDVGCLSMKAGSHGRTYGGLTHLNLPNIKKFVILDIATLRMYRQDNPDSCQRAIDNNQVLTVSGNLVIKNSVPFIKNLRCQVATA